jgi:hypothetical protein
MGGAESRGGNGMESKSKIGGEKRACGQHWMIKERDQKTKLKLEGKEISKYEKKLTSADCSESSDPKRVRGPSRQR